MALRIADTLIVRIPSLPLVPAQTPHLDDPFVREAIRIASPALFDEAERGQRGALSSRDARRVDLAIRKYAIRMSTRATPFGLFATCSAGSFGDRTVGRIASRDAIHREVRLDMEAACRLAERLTSDTEVRRRVRFLPNTTIYAVARDVRFYEYWHDTQAHRHYRLVSIEGTPYLWKVLAAAQAGATLDELARAAADAEVSIDEARQYAADLVDNQVLVSELEPSLTDPRFLESMTAIAGDGAVERARTGVTCPVQVDAFRPATLTLAEDLRSDLAAGIAFLVALAPPRISGRLAAFHHDFRERFGDRRVPLLRALDIDIGVAYGQRATAVAPLLEGLDDLGASAGHASEPDDVSRLAGILLPGIRAALAADAGVLALDDLALPRAEGVTFPPSFPALCSVVVIDGRPRIVLRGAGGSSATTLIGRVAHLHPAINAHARAIAAHDAAAYPGRIVADLLHVPEDRHGNVLLHPRIREYEIPCLARSSAETRFQIQLDDLLLAAPNGGRLELWSASRHQEVVPLLSTAHRFDAPQLLPAYRLLGDLQALGTALAATIPVEALLSEVRRLPRLTVGGCIVSPAAWRFDAAEFDSIAATLPPRVRLRADDGESELFLDLADPSCRELLDAELRGRTRCTFVEDLFGEPGQWVRGDDGDYANEVVVSVLCDVAGARP